MSAQPYWIWHNRNVKHSNSRKKRIISINWVHEVRWSKAHSALAFCLISIESLCNPAPFSGQQTVILWLVMLRCLKCAPTCWWETLWRWRALHRDQQPFHPHTEQLLDGVLHKPQSHKQRRLKDISFTETRAAPRLSGALSRFSFGDPHTNKSTPDVSSFLSYFVYVCLRS